MKIYSVDGGKNYTFKTSTNCDFGVVFKVNTVKVVKDEVNNIVEYPALNITFDNVTIKTKNPVITDIETNNSFAGAYFYNMPNTLGIGDESVSCIVNVFTKGVNTIEVNDVLNDNENNKWAAVCGDNVYGPYFKSIEGETSTLNLNINLPSALGHVCAFRDNSRGRILRFGYDEYEYYDVNTNLLKLNVFAYALN